MPTKHPHHNIPYLILAILLLVSNCNEKAVTPQDDIYSNFTRAQLDSLSLVSLQKVDDYPLYTMTYYGDYGFSNYIKPGNKNFSLAPKTIEFHSDRWS